MSSPATPSKSYRPSLYIPGLYSLQAVSRDAAAPDVTIYRENLDSLLAWKQEMVTGKRFSHFALRHATDRTDFFDRLGRGLADDVGVPVPQAQPMLAQDLGASRMALLGRVPWLVERPTYCAGFEAHAGCSAATRSNFYTMADRIINLAQADADRVHVYVLGCNLSPYTVSAMVADMSKVTELTQGVFLDCFKRVRSGWPLQAAHHRTELARTLAGCRYTQLCEWLVEVRALTRPSETAARYRLVLGALPNSLRLKLAQVFVDHAYPEFVLEPGGVETLPPEAVAIIAPRVGPSIDQMLAIPLSKS